MYWEFFSDDSEKEPYASIDDWYQEVRHLVWPSVILFSITAVIIVYVLGRGY